MTCPPKPADNMIQGAPGCPAFSREAAPGASLLIYPAAPPGLSPAISWTMWRISDKIRQK